MNRFILLAFVRESIAIITLFVCMILALRSTFGPNFYQSLITLLWMIIACIACHLRSACLSICLGLFERHQPLIPFCLYTDEEASLQVIRLDVSRTFPMLGVFQSDGLHNRDLHDLLAAFVAYQPTLGYLQGMSFIAGILLLVMGDIYPAFIAFATLMNRPSFYAFYSLDESEVCFVAS